MASKSKRKQFQEHFERVGRSNSLEPKPLPTRTTFPELPEFPNDITLTSYQQLGRLFGRYTAFLAYLSEQLAEHKYEVSRLRILRRQRRAEVVFRSGGIKLQKLAAVHRDGKYMGLEKELLRATATLTAYQGLMWTLKDYLRAVEYETQRRIQEHKGVG